MGYSSYLCKHCDHGIMDAGSTDEGINEWMAHAVMMSDNGSRLIEPQFDGYAGHYERFLDGVWVHFACWTIAGRPEFEAYDTPSGHDPDQGGGSYRGSHDMIDPRIKDEDERARLLAAGIKLRDEKRYASRAREVHEWSDKEEREYYREQFNGEMFRFRWSYFETGEYDENHEQTHPKDGTRWYVSDKLDPEQAEDARRFRGTEDELKAHLSARWAEFLESDEHAAYMAHREAEIAKYRAEEHEKMKNEGRYETSYHPSKVPGDTVIDPGDNPGRPWQGGRSVHTVRDKLLYEEVAVMEAPWKALGSKTFVRDPDYDGNNSAEWEARVEDIRAATRESRRLAEEEAQRLNDEWAAAGYPVPDRE
jgi:hypothetical protein